MFLFASVPLNSKIDVQILSTVAGFIFFLKRIRQTVHIVLILGAVPASFNWLNDKADSHNQTNVQ